MTVIILIAGSVFLGGAMTCYIFWGGETPWASSNMDSKRGIPVPELQSQASIRRRKMGVH